MLLRRIQQQLHHGNGSVRIRICHTQQKVHGVHLCPLGRGKPAGRIGKGGQQQIPAGPFIPGKIPAANGILQCGIIRGGLLVILGVFRYVLIRRVASLLSLLHSDRLDQLGFLSRGEGSKGAKISAPGAVPALAPNSDGAAAVGASDLCHRSIPPGLQVISLWYTMESGVAVAGILSRGSVTFSL